MDFIVTLIIAIFLWLCVRLYIANQNYHMSDTTKDTTKNCVQVFRSIIEKTKFLNEIPCQVSDFVLKLKGERERRKEGG